MGSYSGRDSIDLRHGTERIAQKKTTTKCEKLVSHGNGKISKTREIEGFQRDCICLILLKANSGTFGENNKHSKNANKSNARTTGHKLLTSADDCFSLYTTNLQWQTLIV